MEQIVLKYSGMEHNLARFLEEVRKDYSTIGRVLSYVYPVPMTAGGLPRKELKDGKVVVTSPHVSIVFLIEKRSVVHGDFKGFDEKMLNEFWKKYPNKKGKAEAFAKLKKTSSELFPKVMKALEDQKKLWEDPKFIPHASTWVNQKRWEDESSQASKIGDIDYYDEQ